MQQTAKADQTWGDREELLHIIKDENVTTVYQPIANLKYGTILGYEALTRGPHGSELARPDALFRAAINHGLLPELEALCREKAFANAGTLTAGQLLFINVCPDVLTHSDFIPEITIAALQRHHLTPAQVVFEITESTAIRNYPAIRRVLNALTREGFATATDDVGKGYSSLQQVIELRPQYIKIDMSLVRDIDKDPFKQALMEAIVKFAAISNAHLVAEGIETMGELSTLIRMGVDFGQGYLLARPAAPKPALNDNMYAYIQAVTQQQQRQRTGWGVTLGDIVEETPAVTPQTLVCEVENIFTRSTALGVAVVEDARPVGLVMREKLFYMLSRQYGLSIYHKRPVHLVMDKSPLLLDAAMPLDAASQIVMHRDPSVLYDYIVVVENGHYRGAVSIMNLLNSITRLQIESARHANPLTGLPGNIAIETALKQAVSAGRPFAVMYIDLDYFKGYNDRYGFEQGDQAILAVADVLRHAVREHAADTFLGHIGGDDFIIITTPPAAPVLGQRIIDRFADVRRCLYPPSDLARGYVDTTTRSGAKARCPLLSISVAVVTNEQHSFTSHLEISELAAEAKRQAKRQAGSSLAII